MRGSSWLVTMSVAVAIVAFREQPADEDVQL